MKVDEMLTQAREMMTARTVFAEPIERDGALSSPRPRCAAAVGEAATARGTGAVASA